MFALLTDSSRRNRTYNLQPMKKQLASAFVLALAALPTFAQTDAIDAKQAVLVIQHDGSEGQVRVNGVPMHFFSSKRVGERGPLTDSLGMFAAFAKNGPNMVVVEARPEKGQQDATTTVSAFVATGSATDLDKPLFNDVIKGTGNAEKTIMLKNVPAWAFLKAQPFTGNKDEVLEAVRKLHKAFMDHDAATVQAMLRPMYDDLAANMGEASVGTPQEFAQQMREFASAAKVEPLPANLKVESGYENRLFVVLTGSGEAPIQTTSKETSEDGKPRLTFETGAYRIHRPDGWFVIRQ
jgi:hypothetical protein